MPLDFSKFSSSPTVDSLTTPRDLFTALPGKQGKYGYLRDVQAEVLAEWQQRKHSTDLRLKMNTGGGKTLVGLLILKTCLNEEKGPAVYLAPTPYLVSQVVLEAQALGLPIETDPRSTAVSRGRAILATHIHVLFNGLSKFGVGVNPAIPIGSIVVDDAHSCLCTAEEQFTLQLSSNHPAYAAILALFRPDLEQQSPTILLDIEDGDHTRLVQIPFWSWHDKLERVVRTLHGHREEDQLKFWWPLVGDSLRECRCVISSRRIEISPRCLPVDMIPSFVRAGRRIFMSATFADDGILITDFNANPEEIAVAIAPSSASDIGDRMILVPQELDPAITDEEIRELAVEKSRTRNVVVIVPSRQRATTFWGAVAARILVADTLEEGVELLKRGHVGLVVIINKYDGIDLPGEACRLLILDGIPDARRDVDRMDEFYVQDTWVEAGKSIQQIEQGMGRAVRATDDFCAIVLMGRSLTAHLFRHDGIARFTSATRVQFALSEQVTQQIRGKGIGEIRDAIDLFLRRDAGWVALSRSALVSVKFETASTGLSLATARRRAYDASRGGDHAAAMAAIQAVVNDQPDRTIKSCFMYDLATYTHPENPVNAQQILKSAGKMNAQLPRPLSGISYTKLSALAGDQSVASLRYLNEQYKTGNDIIVDSQAIAADLEFRPDSHRRFHAAMGKAARILGFSSHFPEDSTGRGPDVLWAVGGLQYFVIECKNEAVVPTVVKDYCNQLAGSANWFLEKYDDTCTGTPVLVHPSNVFEHAATPPPGARVMTKEKLPEFRQAFLDYCRVVSASFLLNAPADASNLLRTYNLFPEQILRSFTVDPRSR